MAGLPFEGFTDAYRIELTTGFLYKAMVHALLRVNPDAVPSNVASCGKNYWGSWPVSNGCQDYKIQAYKRPVSQPIIKLAAFFQTMGQVKYTHEMEIPANGVNGAFVQSSRALANYYYKLPDSDQAITIDQLSDYLKEHHEGFFDLITHKDIPVGGVQQARYRRGPAVVHA